MRVARLGAHAARHSRPHAGHADIDHHRSAKRGDLLEKRIVPPVVDAEMLHDRMEVEAHHLQIADGVARFLDGALSLGRFDRTPSLNDAGMPVAQPCNVIIGTGRRSDGVGKIERHETRLDAVCFQCGHRFAFRLGLPLALPIGGERIDIGALAIDPWLRAGIRVEVDLPHGHTRAVLGRAWARSAAHSDNFFFETLPKLESGNSSTTSRRSGSLILDISFPSRNRMSSSKESTAPGCSTMQAHMRSPSSASGTGTQATFCTLGWERIRFSISSALIFSPPRLIRSFLRPSTI